MTPDQVSELDLDLYELLPRVVAIRAELEEDRARDRS